MENENQAIIEMYVAYLRNKHNIDIPSNQLENLESIIEAIQRLKNAFELGKPKQLQ